MAKAKQTASSPEAVAALSQEHRRMEAYGIATMHRFVPEPSLKYGKSQYKNASTVASIAHAKSKREK